MKYIKTPYTGRGFRIFFSILMTLALSCKKTSSIPITSALKTQNTDFIASIGISFSPPEGWVKIDEELLLAERAKIEGLEQTGCFNAIPITVFSGPMHEQFIISELKPNIRYDDTQSALSQMARHTAIQKSYFAISGHIQSDKLEIAEFKVFRVSGKDDYAYFSKFFFLNDNMDPSGSFAVDVIFPIESYMADNADSALKSVLSLRRAGKPSKPQQGLQK